MVSYLFGITDTGMVRDNNEDVFIAQEVMDARFLIAGVIDGVGGYEGGEIAAALTKDAVLTELTVIGPDVLTQLEISFNLANEEIYARKLEDKQLANMACVATVAVLDRQNNLLHYIHVGDTRLYLFRDNSLIKLSSDQSPVGFLEDSGRISEEAAMQHPKRNVINQALGLGTQDEMAESYFETGSSPFLPGDLILVCSDGLTDMVNKEQIMAVLSTSAPLKAKAEKLVAAANAAGGNDNITIVLAKNDKVPVVHPVLRPVADLFSQGTHDVPAPKAITKENDPVVKENMAAEDKRSEISSADKGAEDINAMPMDNSPRIVPVENDNVEIRPANRQNNPFLKQEHAAASGSLAESAHGLPKSNKGLLILLSVLCVLFLASTSWLFFTNPPVKLKGSGSLNAVQAAGPNRQEKMISDTLSKLKGDTLTLSAALFKGPVRLSRSLTINRDTLLIKTSGDVIFQRDSVYKGPALVLSPVCKYIVIDGLVLENFETGIISYKNVLDLKNVRFNNCKYPLQVLFEFPDHSYVNGRVSKRAFQADSLVKK
ncbi:PP2C family protein-serine/threonine phosphatase [Pedobacter hartonius]|uniref:Serine/threonine protein phosphatase PrpC n=1 Tax=Pedobacter hartonius TaxID=425514 RepID=A0A1H4AYZ8_9SPHI|nr:PP2C family serine/threonine-protein phosphatase [Pedobacter hartonius]SEA41034.1 Serine/threonine protein phosphatase PrpC [Pedobacter hartonius]